MSGPRSHRSPKIRFFLYGFAVCFVAATFYIYKLKQDHIEFLQRCRAEQSTLSAQLRAVIDYRERMQHSLTAARSQHADAIAALHSQQEEQSKLTKNHIQIQSLYNNLTQECTKLKSAAQADHELVETYKNQHEESVSNYLKIQKELEDKTYTTNDQIETLKNENLKMKIEIQQYKEMKNNLKSSNSKSDNPATPVFDTSRNINRQTKTSDDMYVLKVSTEPEKSDIASVNPVEKNRPSIGTNSNNSIVESNNRGGRSGETMKAEIPHGVLPELPVEDNSNDKLPNRSNRPSNEIKSNAKPARTPNRYKTKLDENNPGDKPEKEKNYPFAPAAEPDKDFNKNGNADNLNEVDSKFERDIDNNIRIGAQIEDDEEYREGEERGE